MTFSVDDYEKAIARIFDQKGHVIGTGFLVAPGYVLTCAHVVLQAIDISKEEFASYEGQPQESIALDFHILATGQTIEADVVAWLPYCLDQGDVAALKLRTPAPQDVRPIPLVEVSRVEVETDKHAVYGFGKSESGGRSDAYCPKANVAGGRFQLCKYGDEKDETIKPGFSGAPVWNENRQCVIGMVATAVVAKSDALSTAYAIPTKELRPVLKQVDALSLHDVLQHSLDSCQADNDRVQLHHAIDAALQSCNPNGYQETWSKQLIDLSIDRAPADGWEKEGQLIRFAVMLAWMKETPTYTYDQIEDWIEQHNLNFAELLARFTREVKQQKVPVSRVCQHLMVTVEPKETSDHDLRVAIWAATDRDTYDPNQPLQPIVREHILPIQDLPKFIRQQIREKFRKRSTPMIHLFVPRMLFESNVEMLPCSTLSVFGSEYPIVMRTNLNAHPIGYYYYDDWIEKWNELEQAWDTLTQVQFERIDCTGDALDIVKALVPTSTAVLENCSDISDLFELIAEETALPVALWVRNQELQDQLDTILDCILKRLPERIQQERCAAHRAKDQQALGHHLGLVWEDPKIVPPDMQFDPEAC